MQKITGLLLVALFFMPFAIGEDLEKSVICITCDGYHKSADFQEKYKGMVVYLCSQQCLKHYHEFAEAGRLDEITWHLEPRAGLFHEDSNPKPQLSYLYMYIGIYILVGLIFGGIASYTAVQKGLAGWPAFILGLLMNLAGLCIVWLMPKKEAMFSSRGLSKVPTTRDEVVCPQCQAANHPAATACNHCQAQLTPSAPSEVALSGLDKE